MISTEPKNLMKFSRGILFLFISLFVQPLFAQNDIERLSKEIKVEAQRVSVLMEWDSTFALQTENTLAQLQNKNEAITEKVLSRLLLHFQAIHVHNKSRVKLQFEEYLLTWLQPLIDFSENPESNQSKIAAGFPDSYFPAKILAPELLNSENLALIAENHPKELMHMLRFMVNQEAVMELEWAALNAPFEAKQYLHYSNNVHETLKKSTDERIVLLIDLYNQYRYGSKCFYLLDKIYKQELTSTQAHELMQQREKLYNTLVEIYKDSTAIGRASAEEMLSEISDKYARKLIYQRYLSAASLNMEMLQQLTYDAKIYFFFSSQGVLKKKDIENLTMLYLKEEVPPINESILTWIPIEWVVQFYERIQKDKLETALKPLISASLWEALKPKIPIKIEKEEEDIAPLIIPQEIIVKEPEYVFLPYLMSLTSAEKELIKLENNPYYLLEDLSKLTGKNYSKQILLNLAKSYPVEVVAQLDKFKNEAYSPEILIELAKNAPLTAKNYLVKKDHPIHPYWKSSKDTAILTLYHIDSILGNWTRAYILLDKIVKKELTYQKADTITKDRKLLLPHLIDIFKRNEYLGSYTVEKELEYQALDFIRNFNISANTDQYFSAELNALNAESIYTFIVFGEQEIIFKTFQAMFNRLVVLYPQGFSDLFKKMNHKYTDKFVRMAVHYGKEAELFQTPKNNNDLLSTLFNSLEDGGQIKVANAIEAAEIIIGINDKTLLSAINDIIKIEYERLEKEKNDEGVATYGILASILAQKQKEIWSFAASKHFQIPNLNTIPVYSLFNEDLVNIQQYYFYNDADGISSYRNFIKQYEASNFNWEIEDLGKYIKITSKSGKSVVIYANKPTEGEMGIQALENHMRFNKLSPQILVHRGLSTHTLKTFTRVPESTKLILDGSCGGFHIQSVALENAPGAQILCNRNIGTMHINDPMFKQISESIRLGKDIVWPSFWNEMEAKLGTNPYFKDYIPPHKNVAAIILKAYYDVLGINN
jgi:hypothetical protein